MSLRTIGRFALVIAAIVTILGAGVAVFNTTSTAAAPSLVHKYSAVVGDGTSGFTSVTATFTTAPTAGNLLIAVFGESGNNTINPPSGWSTAVTYSHAPGGAIFYKIASGSETTVTVSTTE
jgi:hypothetical protein